MDKHLRFNKKCKLVLFLLLSVAGMTKADVPAGAINGIFSVSENTQVYFSQGNLQYQASTNTWRFAENQYNYIGSPNTNVSSTYSGWIDLFGWGTSGYHNSSDSYNTNYYPYSTSTSVVNSTYNRYGYGPSTNMTDPNLTNTSANYDWGVYNSISNGGNTANTWRVLTQAEWNYVLNTRVTTSGIRYAKARVNYVNGLILLPDNWSASTYSLSNTNSSGASFNSNSISGTQWTTLENAGAVFLPAAGNRNGTSIEFVDSYCLYWSASYENSLSAYNVYCGNDDLWISGSGRCYGLSVRLVSTVSTITNPLIGAINGLFSVSASQQVYFSQGNLQYQASTNTWRFADNQYDYVGSANSNISSTYSGWIDLFGWGTSGYHDTSDLYNVNYQPWSSSTSEVNNSYNNYGYGPSTNMTDPNLTGTSGNYDWGVYNPISNGGNEANLWRTLTTTEWQYVFNTRTTTSGIRYAMAIVNGVKGIILLPDSWSNSTFSLNNTNNSSANFNSNTLTASQWSALEQAGAVFLPAAGYRYGTSSVYFAGSNCSYWSASYYDTSRAFSVIYSNSLNASANNTRYYGRSVRLVRVGSQNVSFTIDATANPAEGGEVSGMGTYQEGTECTLTATPNVGYTFVNWTKNGAVVSTNASYTFTVTEAGSYVAHFQLNSYQITASATPSAGGAVSGNGTYSHGSSCTLTATNNTGYTFVNWTKNGTVVSTNASYTFTVTEAGSYVAHFQLNSYQITASATPSAGGSVSGAGTYSHGSNCTLTATNNTGYTFVNWTRNGTVVSTNASYTFTVTGAGSYVAHFQLNSYQITASATPSAGGSVSGAGTYNHGSNCTLTATNNTGYTFVNWTRNGTVVSTNASYTFTVTEAGSYVAHFQLNSYQITASATPSAGGSVSGAGIYNHGSNCTLTATNNTGYIFVNWTRNGTVVSTNASYTFTVTGAGSYVAHFQLNSYQITASVNPSAGGSVSGSGTYSHGSSCTLTATANEGYEFVNWTENGEEVSNDATYSFTVTGDRTLVANFSEIPPDNHWTSITGTQYNLTMSGLIYIDGVAQTSTALEIGAFCGDECRGSARAQYFPPTGEYVVSLAVVSNQQSGETITFRLYDHDTQQEFPSECVNSITFVANANFGEMGNWYSFAFNNTVAIAATVTPEGAGVVEGVGDYLIGTSCTLTATANTGYTFVNWTRNGTVVSTNASYTFTVTEACSYVAHFQLNSYQITASATPSAGGSVSGAGTYNHGSNCTLTATNNTGYTFVNWTENGSVVSTDNPYTFTVNGAVELTANFSLNSYDITAIANPAEGGTITGTGAYNHFSTCTLTATANTGYVFRSWSVAGEVVSMDNPYTFTVSGGVEVTANFDAQETTTLAEGWTWWSTSIDLSDIDGLTMLEESLGHNGLMIKSANKFVQNYYPSTGYDYWFGQLTSDDFTNASSYMIQTSASCDVTMTGTYADPSDHPIQLYPGWTWIGYPCGTEQSAASAFANFTPTANDKVKSQYAFSTYYDNYGWFPEFTMTLGEGYLYQSLASGTRTLTFANGSKDNPQPANKEDHYWRNNIHAYADNMNIIAVVTIDGEEQQGEDLELGAFVDGECRGSAVLKHFQPTDRWYAMLTVAGTDGEQIEFGIIDKGKGLTSMTSDRNLAFQANAVVGELDEPYTIGFGTLGCVENNLMGMMHIYPNPIDRNTAFSIVIPETETVRSIYIVNMMGEVMAHETNMTRSLAIQVPGVYTIKVVCHSGNVYVRKLIVK